MLATQSGTRALGDARQSEFLDRVRLDRWPRLTANFVGFLTVGKRNAVAEGS